MKTLFAAIVVSVFLIRTPCAVSNPPTDVRSYLTHIVFEGQDVPRSLLPKATDVIDACSRALDEQPHPGEMYRLHCQRAEAFLILQDQQSAQADITRARTLEPESARALILQAKVDAREGRLEQSIKLCTHLLEKNPDSTRILTLRASCHLGQSDQYKRAIEDASQAIKVDSKYLQAYLVRGAAYELSRNYDAALADFDSYLEKRRIGGPLWEAKPYLFKGRMFSTLEKHQDAIREFDLALGIDPESHPAATGLWVSLRALHKAESRLAAEKMHSIAPMNSMSHIAMGTELYSAGEFAAAVPFLEKWVANSPANAKPLSLLARAHYQLEDYQTAKVYFDSAMAKNSNDLAMIIDRAGFLALCPDREIRNPREALEVVETVLGQQVIQDERQLIVCAIVLYSGGKTHEAIRIIKTLQKEHFSQGVPETGLLTRLLDLMESQSELRIANPILAESLDHAKIRLR